MLVLWKSANKEARMFIEPCSLLLFNFANDYHATALTG